LKGIYRINCHFYVSQFTVILEFFETEGGVNEVVNLVQEYAQRVSSRQQEDSVPYADEAAIQSLAKLIKLNYQGVRASDVLLDVKENDLSVFGRYTASGIARIFKRYGLHSQRSGGKSYFRPTDAQLPKIQDSYGINLGIEPAERALSAHCALSKGCES